MTKQRSSNVEYLVFNLIAFCFLPRVARSLMMCLPFHSARRACSYQFDVYVNKGDTIWIEGPIAAPWCWPWGHIDESGQDEGQTSSDAVASPTCERGLCVRGNQIPVPLIGQGVRRTHDAFDVCAASFELPLTFASYVQYVLFQRLLREKRSTTTRGKHGPYVVL